jgi:hypothetical protein
LGIRKQHVPAGEIEEDKEKVGGFERGRIATRSTAFEHDLYARENVPEEQRHIFETFFAKLDSETAPLYQRLLRRENLHSVRRSAPAG